MLHAVYARTLRSGVTDKQFIEAWLPPGLTPATYPVEAIVARSLDDPRRVLSIFEIDVAAEDFASVLPALVHPDSATRLDKIVETTSLEGVYAETRRFGAGIATDRR